MKLECRKRRRHKTWQEGWVRGRVSWRRWRQRGRERGRAILARTPTPPPLSSDPIPITTPHRHRLHFTADKQPTAGFGTYRAAIPLRACFLAAAISAHLNRARKKHREAESWEKQLDPCLLDLLHRCFSD